MLLPDVSHNTYFTAAMSKIAFEGDPDMEHRQDSVILGKCEEHSIMVSHLKKPILPRSPSLSTSCVQKKVQKLSLSWISSSFTFDLSIYQPSLKHSIMYPGPNQLLDFVLRR